MEVIRPIAQMCDICPCLGEQGLKCVSWRNPGNCLIAASGDDGRQLVLDKSRARAGRPTPDPIIAEGRRAMKAAGGPTAKRKLSASDYQLLKVISQCPHSKPCNCVSRECDLGKGVGGKVRVFDCLDCVGTDARVAWELAGLEPAIMRRDAARKSKRSGGGD